MLPVTAPWMVATVCRRVPGSPRTSPPQRAASSASVYPAVMPSGAALGGNGVGGLVVLLHLRQHLVGHIHRAVLVDHALGDDQVELGGLGELLGGLEHVL